MIWNGIFESVGKWHHEPYLEVCISVLLLLNVSLFYRISELNLVSLFHSSLDLHFKLLCWTSILHNLFVLHLHDYVGILYINPDICTFELNLMILFLVDGY
jgi:hypothetical protein